VAGVDIVGVRKSFDPVEVPPGVDIAIAGGKFSATWTPIYAPSCTPRSGRFTSGLALHGLCHLHPGGDDHNPTTIALFDAATELRLGTAAAAGL